MISSTITVPSVPSSSIIITSMQKSAYTTMSPILSPSKIYTHDYVKVISFVLTYLLYTVISSTITVPPVPSSSIIITSMQKSTYTTMPHIPSPSKKCMFKTVLSHL